MIEAAVEKLIEFFESKCLEPKLYWRVRAGDEQAATFELEWHRDRKAKWHLRPLAPADGDQEPPWQVFTTAELSATLEQHGIDQDNLRRQIESTTLQQVVFAKMMVDDARAFFGEDVVAEAVAETESFLGELRTVVKGLMDDPDKPPVIRLVKDSD